MKQNYLLILLIVAIVLIPSNAPAIVMDDLYIVELPATDQSVAERQTLILTAFKQLLFKLTGNDQAFANMQTKLTTSQIEKCVSSFSYIERAIDPLQLKIIFNESVIISWLQNFKIPYVNKNRPIILSWLLVDKGNGFKLIREDEQELMITKLEQLAVNHAIPLVFPLLDLDERNEVEITDILNNSAIVLQEAITKYNADAVLIGKIIRSGEEWQAKWNILGITTNDWDITEHTIDELYAQLMFKLRNDLLNDYATIKKSKDLAVDVVKIKVTEINSIDRYAKILEYLRGLKIVDLVKVIDVTSNYAIFELNINGDKEVVKKAINLDQLLEQTLTFDNAQDVVTNTLHYRVRL